MKYVNVRLNKIAFRMRLAAVVLAAAGLFLGTYVHMTWASLILLAGFMLFWSYSLGDWDDPVSPAHFRFEDEPATGQEVVFVDEDLRPIGRGVYLYRGEWDIIEGTEHGAKYWRPV